MKVARLPVFQGVVWFYPASSSDQSKDRLLFAASSFLEAKQVRMVSRFRYRLHHGLRAGPRTAEVDSCIEGVSLPATIRVNAGKAIG